MNEKVTETDSRPLKVFKFGGASIQDPDSIRNVGRILEKHLDDNLLIVVSAMGKTTNALEDLVGKYVSREVGVDEKLEEIETEHWEVIRKLFHNEEDPVFQKVKGLFSELRNLIQAPPTSSYDKIYDTVVPFGELLSSTILSYFLEVIAHFNVWMDARELIMTNEIHRRAKVDQEGTRAKVQNLLAPAFKGKEKPQKVITQGFIGSTGTETTTLGREGSDYSAAILAYFLEARSLTIWKDVPGVLNADPRYFEEVKKLERISYREAIELSYYGAKVIHPRTIQPLENKNIPLYVKSFLDPDAPGTLVTEEMDLEKAIPSYILKKDQVLISITPKDLSFVVETDLSYIFDCFAKTGVPINMMQNSAIDFSVSVDDSPRTSTLVEELQKDYEVRYNTGLDLLTIRHYDDPTIEKLTKGHSIYLEQKSRHTVQFVMR